jgi:hypothetical protein
MKYLHLLTISLSFFLASCGQVVVDESFEPKELEKVLADMELFDPEAFAPVDDEDGNVRDPNVDSALRADGYDPFLRWNEIILDANANDHALTNPDQGGPTQTTRAFAMVHIAMYEAANAVLRIGNPYLNIRSRRDVHVPMAVAAAAHKMLWQLYPQQRSMFDRALREAARASGFDDSVYRGFALGRYAAKMMIENRQNDGSQNVGNYQPTRAPGAHQVDPLNPNQGYLGAAWGQVTPFVLTNSEPIRVAAPPALTSSEYTAAYEEVRKVGGDGVITPTERTEEQTEIGLFWAYDGTPGLGTPPRFFNQIVRMVGEQQGNTASDNALILTRVNAAMADAAIISWYSKYRYNIWRPIVAIRNGERDTNPKTKGDAAWTPLGAPASNTRLSNFTPNFPAYTSGHAVFGGAVFRTLENFYGTDAISFTIVSDELNGRTRDSQGGIRARSPRSFSSFSEAAEENAMSRLYLGIHWRFDATEGVKNGRQIADVVTSRFP